MVGKNFTKKSRPKICFFDPRKWSENSIFQCKMVVFCIFTNFKNALPDICLGFFLLPNKIGGGRFTRNKKRRSNYVPKHVFWAPKKGSGKSFLVKMAYFGHFHALQKYTFLWCFLFPYKSGDESIPNYDFLTPENGHKSHFSGQNGMFLGILTHFKNSLPDNF